MAVDVIALFKLKKTAVKMPLFKPEFDPSLWYTMMSPLYLQASANDWILLFELVTVQLNVTFCPGHANPLTGKTRWIVTTWAAIEQLTSRNATQYNNLPVVQKQFINPKSSKETVVILF